MRADLSSIVFSDPRRKYFCNKRSSLKQRCDRLIRIRFRSTIIVIVQSRPKVTYKNIRKSESEIFLVYFYIKDRGREQK